MKFRTEIETIQFPFSIGYRNPMIMLGSCFSDEIGAILRENLFKISVNPFGVIYNPMSILNAMQALEERNGYLQEDLQFNNELYFSFDHYTKFSDTEPAAALAKINKAFLQAKSMEKENRVYLLTFGTAFIYELIETGQVVNNCHKLPASNFNRRMLNVEEIFDAYEKMIATTIVNHPETRFVFTVSPVRHLKDGMTGNQQSKATLILAIKQLVNSFPENCAYFPAFEIVMDDLRDYRYYGNDLLHPNDQAVEYIWGKFLESLIDEEGKKIMQKLKPILRASGHKPIHSGTAAHKKFMEKLIRNRRKLEGEYPFLQWTEIE